MNAVGNRAAKHAARVAVDIPADAHDCGTARKVKMAASSSLRSVEDTRQRTCVRRRVRAPSAAPATRSLNQARFAWAS